MKPNIGDSGKCVPVVWDDWGNDCQYSPQDPACGRPVNGTSERVEIWRSFGASMCDEGTSAKPWVYSYNVCMAYQNAGTS